MGALNIYGCHFSICKATLFHKRGQRLQRMKKAVILLKDYAEIRFRRPEV